ncbi:MAG: proline dehydrogenase family protein [Gemmatimonadetes bacterium]|nr:proline dehydrogenase family protein [Gemmatimonadota bacterium]
MLRQSLLYLSESPAAQRLVTGTAVSRHLAERFVAGESIAEAIQAARVLNEQGFTVSLDYLGESVSRREQAEADAATIVRILEQLESEGIDGNVSVKPTQLGLEIDEEFCRQNVRRVLDRARELGDGEGEIFVRLDMESSDYAERTVALVEDLWAEGYRNVGTVLQSYLRRTPADLRRLIALGSRVRLVKGAYNEPPEVAFPDKAEVDRKFVEEMQALLEEGVYPAIATHDEAMIDATRHWAFEKGIAKESFEFQMLYGVRRDLQKRLREEGYNVRIYIPFGESWYPYLMRRLAERPANILFMASSVAREASFSPSINPIAIGTGIVAGSVAAVLWRAHRDSR